MEVNRAGIEQVSPVASREGGEGDRRVRGPVGGGADLARGRRRCSSAVAISPIALTADVLPWSLAVLIEVYRLMCSTLRMPAPVARSTSATVWSRCRSTKWESSPARSPSRSRTTHSGWVAPAGCGFSVGIDSACAPPSVTNPALNEAMAPAREPSARHASRVKLPRAAPMIC